MKRSLSLRIIVLLTIYMSLFSCKKENNNPNTYYGPQVAMGNGTIRSYIAISTEGIPLKVGIEMTNNAFASLPTDPLNFAAATFILQLDQRAKDITPYDHITLNWNVHGHEPPGIYDMPHFDFHFYEIPVAEQTAIPPYEVDSSKFNMLPPAGYIPNGYIRSPGGVPQMGTHWADVTSPEFNGHPFNYTIIYGSYNGKVTFLEPMTTLAFLQSDAVVEKEIRQPILFAAAGKYYPTLYTIYKNSATNNHYVEFKNFTKR